GGARRRAGHLAALPLRPESGMATTLPAVAAGPRRRRPADRPGGSAGHTGSGQSESDGVVAPGVAGSALPGGAGRDEHQLVHGLPGVAHLRYAWVLVRETTPVVERVPEFSSSHTRSN